MSRKVTRRVILNRAAAGAAALAVSKSVGAITARIHAGSGSGALGGLDHYCRKALEDWSTPGIALAVIADAKLLLARGYGVRELGRAPVVDENTIFPIASCTKSFTAAAVGMFVDQDKVRWDDSLKQHVPNLVLPAQANFSEPTIRHALQHRTGLPPGNMLWRSGELRADEILRRVRFQLPVAAPGEKFIYNNVMYLAAGKAAELAGRRPWVDLVRTAFFEPLGMKSSLPDCSQLVKFDNVAEPHATIDAAVTRVERYCPDLIAPAGGIHSTAADLSRWVIMHLNRGSIDGHELLSAARVDELQHAVVPPSAGSSKDVVPQAPTTRYGLGWFVNEFAGNRVVEHSGTLNGFVSWMALIPKERIGLVVLSNHHQTGINYALRCWIFDRLLGRPDHDWSSAVRTDFTQGWQKQLRDAKSAFEANPSPITSPARPLADFVGDYRSDLYGTIRVIEESGRLKLEFGSRFRGELKPWQGDCLRAFFSNPLLVDWLVTFGTTAEGVVSLQVQESPWAPRWYEDHDHLGVFKRQ